MRWIEGQGENEQITRVSKIYTCPRVLYVEFIINPNQPNPGFSENGIQEQITLNPMKDDDGPCTYRLVSIGLHTPGHYRAAVRRRNGWWLADDSTVSELERGLNDEDVRRNAKDFFYELAGGPPLLDRPPIGIPNVGENTCWFATMLQMFASSPLFADALRDAESAEAGGRARDYQDFGVAIKEMMTLLSNPVDQGAAPDMLAKKRALIGVIDQCYEGEDAVNFGGGGFDSLGAKLLHVLDLLHATYGTFAEGTDRVVNQDMQVYQDLAPLLDAYQVEMKTRVRPPLSFPRTPDRVAYEKSQQAIRAELATRNPRPATLGHLSPFDGESFVKDLFGFETYKVIARGGCRDGQATFPQCMPFPVVEFVGNNGEAANVKTRFEFMTNLRVMAISPEQEEALRARPRLGTTPEDVDVDAVVSPPMGEDELEPLLESPPPSRRSASLSDLDDVDLESAASLHDVDLEEEEEVEPLLGSPPSSRSASTVGDEDLEV